MTAVQLPPGVMQPSNRQAEITASPTAAGHGVPWGAGRPLVIAQTDAAWAALCEAAREQNVTAGRATIFADGEMLQHCCREYFKWVDANPLLEQKVQFASKREQWAKTDLTKKRPYTQGGLCNYLGIDPQTWANYGQRDEFQRVVANVNRAIYQQKFDGAAAGFFNATIIARDLGLVDRQEVTGADGGPVEKITTTMTVEEAADHYRKSREQG